MVILEYVPFFVDAIRDAIHTPDKQEAIGESPFFRCLSVYFWLLVSVASQAFFSLLSQCDELHISRNFHYRGETKVAEIQKWSDNKCKNQFFHFW